MQKWEYLIVYPWQENIVSGWTEEGGNVVAKGTTMRDFLNRPGEEG